MSTLSPWAYAVKSFFYRKEIPELYNYQLGDYRVTVHDLNNGVYISIACPNGARLILRTAYALGDYIKISKINREKDGMTINASAAIGHFRVKLQFPLSGKSVIRCTTYFKANDPLFIPFFPRDLLITQARGVESDAKGTIYIAQRGTRSGMQYFTMDEPRSGSALYFQNLTSLNDYAEVTGSSLGGVVGGNWPEMGFCLPPTLKEKPIPAHKELIISDAFISLSPSNPKNEAERAKQFLNLLADIYVVLPKPATKYYNWLGMVDQGIHDLEFSHGCWSHGAEQDYLNAYVADYQTPPELMVQLAVMLPLTDYHDWCKTDLPAIGKIKNGLDAFYNKDLKTVVRFLPALANQLSGDEEQLKPNVMDSWYLHHPLLNLGRLAIRGDKQAKKLFEDSLDFTIKVAHHFKYEWPVLYNMETLEAIKAETQPGKGGEKDVAGLYALVMLHAWQLTHEKKYFSEAEKAAKTLQGKGFDLFYQANNTAFGANAMLWLYKETKDELYLDLTYLCIANVFTNFQLWECNYGYTKHYPTFFAMFPLNDAPYTAAYEEQEVFAAMHNLLLYADDVDILPSVSLLIPEFLKYILNRAPYYYPPNLPKEVLSEEIKTGQVDHKLWIAIEDLHDGWEKSGAVGQEVYGAGVAFGIIPRHFYRVPNEEFLIFIDYPTTSFKKGRDKLSFQVKGDSQLTCLIMIITQGSNKIPKFKVKGNQNLLKVTKLPDGNLEFSISGNQFIEINWINS